MTECVACVAVFVFMCGFVVCGWSPCCGVSVVVQWVVPATAAPATAEATAAPTATTSCVEPRFQHRTVVPSICSSRLWLACVAPSIVLTLCVCVCVCVCLRVCGCCTDGHVSVIWRVGAHATPHRITLRHAWHRRHAPPPRPPWWWWWRCGRPAADHSGPRLGAAGGSTGLRCPHRGAPRRQGEVPLLPPAPPPPPLPPTTATATARPARPRRQIRRTWSGGGAWDACQGSTVGSQTQPSSNCGCSVWWASPCACHCPCRPRRRPRWRWRWRWHTVTAANPDAGAAAAAIADTSGSWRQRRQRQW